MNIGLVRSADNIKSTYNLKAKCDILSKFDGAQCNFIVNKDFTLSIEHFRNGYVGVSGIHANY